MRRALLALAIAPAIALPAIAYADGAAPAAPPVDIAAFPPPAGAASARKPGVEVHGVVTTWWTPWSEASPTAATDALRLRFAVLRIDARPAPDVSVLARVGLMLPGSPLLDLAATYQPRPEVGVTFGQFRLPLGASATTLAPQLVMLDRPTYVYAMTKLAFRDVGAMLHSGPAGLADGLVHYRAVAASGSGRHGAGAARAPSAHAYLLGGRVIVDGGPRALGSVKDRLVGGLTLARSHDPAIATDDATTDAALAAGSLGRTLVPIALERDTTLAGADLTVLHGHVWLQAEAMHLRSRAVDGGAAHDALGFSVEAAYAVPARPAGHELQLAARYERFDPDLDISGDVRRITSAGVNASLARLRWSAFATVTSFDDAAGERRHAGELTVRAQATF
jgi:hypothetical protein